MTSTHSTQFKFKRTSAFNSLNVFCSKQFSHLLQGREIQLQPFRAAQGWEDRLKESPQRAFAAAGTSGAETHQFRQDGRDQWTMGKRLIQ
ncbi:hypothetical protein AVEN_53465-1 [Araneus ventricosus]|uniref:Uncharacterized protein n=1 Tax=Araneus ventricosus TaxID=182803 RepID=A0A4Y2AAT7_ARAVE|nr:hypothetical protein AVEN_53465-1 [Araneus ventricosus]